MTDSILRNLPQFEELPCRPPFRTVYFHEQLFTQNVIRVLSAEILALPGTVDQLIEAEKERNERLIEAEQERNERLPIFSDITLVALGSMCRRDGLVFVPMWKPRLHTPIEWVRDYGAAWPVGTRFLLV